MNIEKQEEGDSPLSGSAKQTVLIHIPSCPGSRDGSPDTGRIPLPPLYGQRLPVASHNSSPKNTPKNSPKNSTHQSQSSPKSAASLALRDKDVAEEEGKEKPPDLVQLLKGENSANGSQISLGTVVAMPLYTLFLVGFALLTASIVGLAEENNLEREGSAALRQGMTFYNNLPGSVIDGVANHPNITAQIFEMWAHQINFWESSIIGPAQAFLRYLDMFPDDSMLQSAAILTLGASLPQGEWLISPQSVGSPRASFVLQVLNGNSITRAATQCDVLQIVFVLGISRCDVPVVTESTFVPAPLPNSFFVSLVFSVAPVKQLVTVLLAGGPNTSALYNGTCHILKLASGAQDVICPSTSAQFWWQRVGSIEMDQSNFVIESYSHGITYPNSPETEVSGIASTITFIGAAALLLVVCAGIVASLLVSAEKCGLALEKESTYFRGCVDGIPGASPNLAKFLPHTNQRQGFPTLDDDILPLATARIATCHAITEYKKYLPKAMPSFISPSQMQGSLREGSIRLEASPTASAVQMGIERGPSHSLHSLDGGGEKFLTLSPVSPTKEHESPISKGGFTAKLDSSAPGSSLVAGGVSRFHSAFFANAISSSSTPFFTTVMPSQGRRLSRTMSRPSSAAFVLPGATGDGEMASQTSMEAKAFARPIAASSSLKNATVLTCKVDILEKAERAVLSKAFLTTVLDIAHRFEGFVASFSANSVTVAWNAISPFPFHEMRACSCAIELASALESETYLWAIAIASGASCAGIFGTRRTSRHCVMGQALVHSLLFCDLALHLHCSIILCENVYVMVRTQVSCRPIDIVYLDGEKIALFELAGKGSGEVAHLMEGFTYFCSQRWEQSVACFVNHLAAVGGSRADNQAARLRRTAAAFDAAGTGEPYARLGPAWVIHEIAANDEDIECYCHPSQSPVRRRKSSGASPELYLREELQKTFCSMDEQVWNAANESDDDDETVEISFVDRKGVKWMRSNKLLGTSAFAEVHVGMSEDGSFCAIKSIALLSNPLGEHGGMVPEVEQFLSEIHTLCRLNHPNVVKYLSSGVAWSRLLCIAMEYVGGGTLASALETFNFLSLSAAKRYAIEILRGLKYLHERDIVHGDLNPNNVMLTIEGSCKITDVASTAFQHLRQDYTGCTQYLAPEAAKGTAEKASDIWSFGLVVCAMVAGRLPFKQSLVENESALIEALSQKTIGIDLASCYLPPDAAELVGQCLQLDQEHRPSVEQLLVHQFILL